MDSKRTHSLIDADRTPLLTRLDGPRGETDDLHRGTGRTSRADAADPVRRRSPRIALYSHDAMGVGHVRRNLLIAQTLKQSLQANSLLICGVHEAGMFPAGGGVDCLSLPALAKSDTGEYSTRDLELSLPELIALRSATLKAALASYQPDLLIVDKVPCGIMGELKPALAYLSAQGTTRIVLGLREVLDGTSSVRQEWCDEGYDEWIRRYYDALWVYGDPQVFNAVTEYSFPPDIAARTRFTGYFDQRARLAHADFHGASFLRNLGIHDHRVALCTVGGGQDGGQVALAFARASFPQDYHGLIVTGPFMPPALRAELAALREQRQDLHVVDYVPDVDALMPHVDAIVCMGGYNTLLSVLSFDKPALVVPRVRPRQEQWIRARRFEELGFVSLSHPDDLQPSTITRWLGAPTCDPMPNRIQLDLQAAVNLPRFVAELLAEPRYRHTSHSELISKEHP